MNEIAAYILEVVFIPALIATVFAGLFLLRPLRRRSWLVEAGVASGLALAFLLSFVAELDWRAVARQVVTIEGDDAPFERWHRLGLSALVLIALAWGMSLRRRLVPVAHGMLATLGIAVVVALLAGFFVRYPGSTVLIQCLQGLLVFASIALWALTNQGVLWSAWVVFGVLGALCALGGFASLAVMCGAVSVAGFGMASVVAVLGRGSPRMEPVRPHGAIPIVLGALTALIARCGMVYDTAGTSPAVWTAAALLPAGSLFFSRRFRDAVRPAAKTFWSWIGVALLGAALLGYVAGSQAFKGGPASGESDDDLADMYGG
jgi:hypothetical protein